MITAKDGYKTQAIVCQPYWSMIAFSFATALEPEPQPQPIFPAVMTAAPVIAAEEVEGYKDSKECHEDALCYEDDAHLSCKRSKLREVGGHKYEGKVEL